MSNGRVLSLLALAVLLAACGGERAPLGGDDAGSDSPGSAQDAGSDAGDGAAIGADAFPACFPDLVTCTSPDQCCSRACVDGTCGAASDASLPSTCTPLGSTSCDACLAKSCCPPLGACEQDAECAQALQCFHHCDAPGQELGCEEMCMQGLQTPAGKALVSCTVTSCGAPCQ